MFQKYFRLLICILLTEAAGIVGSTAFNAQGSGSGLAWYAGISKPALTPPSWIFAPVWTTLFILMGISLWIVWSGYSEYQAGDKVSRATYRLALTTFLFQLLLNTLWSIIFFGMHSPGGALIDITLLWLSIAVTIYLFGKISKPAAWLLVPYILWVSFATYLNLFIWILNP